MGGMIGGPVRTRQDVWGLSAIDPWHSTIEWYEYAFHVLRDTTDFSDPRSLEAIANIHGTNRDPATWPAAVGPSIWNACQHFSWYFLPWHRMYLHYYETILREIIDAAQGPSDWALPFWNYDPATPATLALPPAFLQPLRPDGADNALYTPDAPTRSCRATVSPTTDVELTGWPDTFTASSIFVPTFGGPMTGWSHFGNAMGRVEREPHGTVHVDVGGDWRADERVRDGRARIRSSGCTTPTSTGSGRSGATWRATATRRTTTGRRQASTSASATTCVRWR